MKVCQTLGCNDVQRYEIKNGIKKSGGAYCFHCTLMRKRARKAGMTPDNMTKDALVSQFWNTEQRDEMEKALRRKQ